MDGLNSIFASKRIGHFGFPPSYLKYFLIAFYSIRWYLDTAEGNFAFPFAAVYFAGTNSLYQQSSPLKLERDENPSNIWKNNLENYYRGKFIANIPYTFLSVFIFLFPHFFSLSFSLAPLSISLFLSILFFLSTSLFYKSTLLTTK